MPRETAETSPLAMPRWTKSTIFSESMSAPSGDYSASVPSPQPAPEGEAVSGRSGSQKIAWFQKGLPVGGLPSVRPEYPILGLWRAIVSGRFA